MIKIYTSKFDKSLGAKAVNPRIVIGAFIILPGLGGTSYVSQTKKPCKQSARTLTERAAPMKFFLGLQD